MKVLPKVVEVNGEGFLSLLGKKIEVFCANYIYVGTLEGVNETCIKLGEDAAIVFETGGFQEKHYKDAQRLGHIQYLSTSFIESFGPSKKEY